VSNVSRKGRRPEPIVVSLLQVQSLLSTQMPASLEAYSTAGWHYLRQVSIISLLHQNSNCVESTGQHSRNLLMQAWWNTPFQTKKLLLENHPTLRFYRTCHRYTMHGVNVAFPLECSCGCGYVVHTGICVVLNLTKLVTYLCTKKTKNQITRTCTHPRSKCHQFDDRIDHRDVSPGLHRRVRFRFMMQELC